MSTPVPVKPSKRRLWITGAALALGAGAVYAGYATFPQWAQLATSLIAAAFGVVGA